MATFVLAVTFEEFIGIIGDGIYGAQALSAIYGLYLVTLVIRRVKQKRFGSPAAAEDFLNEVRDRVDSQKYEEAAEICDSPPYWSKVVPQLVLVALANRSRANEKLEGILVDHFNREVMSDFEYRQSWINTMIKTAPMLGLLGTVAGMIAAFGKLAAASSKGVDPAQLADDISLALLTTLWGLVIAVPLIMALSWIQVRISKLQDEVQQYVGVFLEDLDNARRKAKRS